MWGAEVCRYPSTFYEPSLSDLNARRSEAQPGSIGHPAHRHDHKRRLGTASVALLGEDHPQHGSLTAMPY